MPRSTRPPSAEEQRSHLFSQTAPSNSGEILGDNFALEPERFEYEPQQPSTLNGNRSSNARRRQQQLLDPRQSQRQPIDAFLPTAFAETLQFSKEADGGNGGSNVLSNTSQENLPLDLNEVAIDGEVASPAGSKLSGQGNGVAMAGVRDLRALVRQRHAAGDCPSSGVGEADYSMLGENLLAQPLSADSPRQPLKSRNHRSYDPGSSSGTRKERSPRQPNNDSHGSKSNPALGSFLPGLGPTARISDAVAQNSDGRKMLFSKSYSDGFGARSGDMHSHNGNCTNGSNMGGNGSSSSSSSSSDSAGGMFGTTARKGAEFPAEAPLSASMERIVELRRRRHEAQANNNHHHHHHHNTVAPMHLHSSATASTNAANISNNYNNNSNRNSNGNTSSNSITTATMTSTDTTSAAPSSEGLVGLSNLGNTCFMNAALQCLLATKPLLAYFAPGSATATAVINQHPPPPVTPRRGALRSSSSSRCDPGRAGDGVVAAAFGRLVSEMAKEEAYGHVAPRELKAVVARQAPWLAGYQQQDCQEFLRFLLDGLSEDLKRAPRVPMATTATTATTTATLPCSSSSPELHDPADGSPASSNDPAGNGNNVNIANGSNSDSNSRAARPAFTVEDVFGGQLQSKVQCTVCGAASTCFDPFLDLSLPIPEREVPGQQGRRGRSGGGSAVSLEACLSEFCATEELTGVNCSTCNKKQTCLKTLTMHTLPPYLVLHLKRFAYTVRSREKLNAPVRFPIKGLNLAPFVTPPPSPNRNRCFSDGGDHSAASDTSPSQKQSMPEEARLREDKAVGTAEAGEEGAAAVLPPVLYDLYGVANHMGALGGGHYTASCLQRAPPPSSSAAAGEANSRLGATGGGGRGVNKDSHSGPGSTTTTTTTSSSSSSSSNDDDGRWFSYNDTNVTPMNDPLRDLNPEMAYVLFYQRRQP